MFWGEFVWVHSSSVFILYWNSEAHKWRHESHKQTVMAEDLKLYPSTQGSVPKTFFFKGKLLLHSLYFSQNTLMLSDTRGVQVICILFLDLARFVIAHFQKEWETGARVGARSVMGSFGGAPVWKQMHVRPPNDPIIECAPNLAPDFHSFWKWAIEAWHQYKNQWHSVTTWRSCQLDVITLRHVA